MAWVMGVSEKLLRSDCILDVYIYSFPGCILKVEPTRLAVMKCERKREVRDGSKTSHSWK